MLRRKPEVMPTETKMCKEIDNCLEMLDLKEENPAINVRALITQFDKTEMARATGGQWYVKYYGRFNPVSLFRFHQALMFAAKRAEKMRESLSDEEDFLEFEIASEVRERLSFAIKLTEEE